MCDRVESHFRDLQGAMSLRQVVVGAGVGSAVLGTAALWLSETVARDQWNWLAAWCVCAAVLLVPVLARALGNWRVWLMEPIATLCIAFMAYFVIGCAAGLVWHDHPYMLAKSDVTQADARSMLRASAACSLGLALSVLGYVAAEWVPGIAHLKTLALRVPPMSSRSVAAVFLLVGGLAQLVTVLLWLRGVATAVDNLLSLVSNLAMVGIVLAVWTQAETGRFTQCVVAICMAGGMAVFGLATLSKTAALMPIVALVLGWGLRGQGIWRGVLLVGAPVALSVALVSIITTARAHAERQGGTSTASMDGLVEASRDGTDASEYSLPIARLHYTSTQSAMMRFYDDGVRGSDLELIPWLVVPRALAPDKPIPTRSGPETYRLITGHEGSSDSPGVFIQGYFNLGWMGLACAAVLTGLVLGQYAAVCRALGSGATGLLLPIILLGHLTAMRIDGHFVAEVLQRWVFLWLAAFGVIAVGKLVCPSGSDTHAATRQ